MHPDVWEGGSRPGQLQGWTPGQDALLQLCMRDHLCPLYRKKHPQPAPTTQVPCACPDPACTCPDQHLVQHPPTTHLPHTYHVPAAQLPHSYQAAAAHLLMRDHQAVCQQLCDSVVRRAVRQPDLDLDLQGGIARLPSALRPLPPPAASACPLLASVESAPLAAARPRLLLPPV
eukprot:224832-Chlamydomonas_euryale.AAC.5